MAPALKKDGRYCVRKNPTLDKDQREEDETDKGDLKYHDRPLCLCLSAINVNGFEHSL